MREATLLRGFEPRELRIRGARLRYFVGGSGPPLVLVHGLGGAATNWTELAVILARRFRLLIPDLPGHGRSEPLPSPSSLAAFADRVALVAEGEGMLPAPLVGHSFGGSVAVRLALGRPEAVRALVLAAVASRLAFSPGWRRAASGALELVRPSRLAAQHRRRIAHFPLLRWLTFGYWGAADPPALSAQAVLGFLEGAALASDTKTPAQALAAEDVRHQLGAIGCPTLLLWGSRDRLVPLEHGFEYARRLRAPIRVLPSTGHLLIGERPAECAQLIEEFLDRIGQVDEDPVEAEPLGQLRR